jgi:hypothetical protein
MQAILTRACASRCFLLIAKPSVLVDVTVTTRRTLHLRFNDVKDPAAIPGDTDRCSNPTSRSCCSNKRGSIHVTPSSSLLSTMSYAQT